MSTSRRRIVRGGVQVSVRRLLLAAASLCLLTFASTSFAQGGPPAMPVTVSEPLAKRVTQWDEYSGRFEAVASVEVRARVSGFIDKIDFRDGQIVRQGGWYVAMSSEGEVLKFRRTDLAQN